MSIEDQLIDLSETFKMKPETVKKIYNELITKKCVIEDDDEDTLLECIYNVLQEKSEIANRQYKEDKMNYRSTNDYAINKALMETYKEAAIQDLSEKYIEYIDSVKEYTNHSSLERFYEDNNVNNYNKR